MDNLTKILEGYETLVKDKKIASFWVSIRQNGLRFEAAHKASTKIVLLDKDMLDSIDTFFYGVARIEYGSHDYANLKSFVNAHQMLDRLLSRNIA